MDILSLILIAAVIFGVVAFLKISKQSQSGVSLVSMVLFLGFILYSAQTSGRLGIEIIVLSVFVLAMSGNIFLMKQKEVQKVSA